MIDIQIRRAHASPLKNQLKTFPIVLVVGSRQAGKTTMVRATLPDWTYVDLERTRDLEAVAGDLEGFLENHTKVIFDEAQRLPSLFPALRSAVDRKQAKCGQFVLTGSARLSLRQMAGESLAGRMGILELTPFRVDEINDHPAWVKDRWFWGGYPPIYRYHKPQQRLNWLDSYIDAFLNTDLPGLGIRVPALKLRRFWTMLAHYHGGILNSSEIGRSLSLSHHTVNDYLDILEATFVVRRLPPFFANIGKRLTKSPKVYIRDTGLLHRLIGLRNPRELESHPKRGASWEGFVLEEMIERFHQKDSGAQFYFWGTQAGGEVDLLVHCGGKLLPIEIKGSYSVDSRSLLGLKTCMADLKCGKGYVIYRGKERLKLGGSIELAPWINIEKGGLQFLGAK